MSPEPLQGGGKVAHATRVCSACSMQPRYKAPTPDHCAHFATH